MRKPKDLDQGVRKFLEFHDFEPRHIGKFKLNRLPTTMYCLGEAIDILYRSDKWEKKHHDYIHKHDGGVHLYVNGSYEGGEKTVVPKEFSTPKTLVLIGQCLGFSAAGEDEKYEAAFAKHRPELYCHPDEGRCLYVIQHKQELLAMIWGGSLRVEDRGIVG